MQTVKGSDVDGRFKIPVGLPPNEISEYETICREAIKYQASINGQTIYFSDLTGDAGGGYPGAIAFIKNSDGYLEPHFVYFSNSRAQWRVAPGRDYNNRFCKGHECDQELNLPPQLNIALTQQFKEDIRDKKFVRCDSFLLRQTLPPPISRIADGPEEYFSSVTYNGDLPTPNIQDDPDDLPDFENGIIDIVTMENEFYGGIIADDDNPHMTQYCVLSKNKKFQYLIAEIKKGGAPYQFVLSGIPTEYHLSQFLVPKEFGNFTSTFPISRPGHRAPKDGIRILKGHYLWTVKACNKEPINQWMQNNPPNTMMLEKQFATINSTILSLQEQTKDHPWLKAIIDDLEASKKTKGSDWPKSAIHDAIGQIEKGMKNIQKLEVLKKFLLDYKGKKKFVKDLLSKLDELEAKVTSDDFDKQFQSLLGELEISEEAHYKKMILFKSRRQANSSLKDIIGKIKSKVSNLEQDKTSDNFSSLKETLNTIKKNNSQEEAQEEAQEEDSNNLTAS